MWGEWSVHAAESSKGVQKHAMAFAVSPAQKGGAAEHPQICWFHVKLVAFPFIAHQATAQQCHRTV
jgi:hypothetical protein